MDPTQTTKSQDHLSPEFLPDLPTESRERSTRRGFLRTSGLGLVAAFVAARLVTRGHDARAADAPKAAPVDPKDSTAQALGYVEDAKKADTKKFPKRAAADGAKQFCYNCMFYQEKNNPKGSASGPCTIFAGKLVKSHGWCNSWTQNANVKD